MIRLWLDRLFWLTLPALHLVVLAGLILRRSTTPQIFDLYSWKTLVLIIVLAISWVFWPFVIKRWFRQGGPQAEVLVSCDALFLVIFESLPVRPWVGERDGHFHPHLQIISWHTEPSEPPAPTGFRSGPVTLEKQPQEYRVVLMGGSTAMNLHMSLEESISGQLESLLQKDFPDRRIRVINASNVWFTTHHTVINYLQRVRPLSPDLVIVFHAINDMCRSFHPLKVAVEPFRVDYSHFLGPQIDLFARANQGAWQQSNVNYFLTQILFTRLDEPKEFVFKKGPWPWPSLPIFKRNLQTLAELTLMDQTPLILGTQGHYLRSQMTKEQQKRLVMFPHLFRNINQGPDLNEVDRAFHLFNQATRDVCSEYQIPLVDLDLLIPPDEQYFVDDVHFTEKGADFVAQQFFQKSRLLVSD